MNKKGSIFFYGLMLGLTIIILGLALAPSVQEFTEDATNLTNGSTQAQNLDCANSSISSFDKGACLVTDVSMPYFIGTMLLIGGAIITARILL